MVSINILLVINIIYIAIYLIKKNCIIKLKLFKIMLALEKIKEPENLLKNIISYSSYPERINNIITLLDKLKVKKLSEFFNYPIYDITRYIDTRESTQFKHLDLGIYDIRNLNQYIGYIPENNQLEIIQNFKVLKEHPFIKMVNHGSFSGKKYADSFFILAPKNNFAIENNIKGIDPIVFAYCTYHDDGHTCHILVPLTQWL